MKNTVLSIVKVVLPVFMVVFSAYGIYASVGIANIIAFCFSIGLLVYNFNYHPKISLNISIVKKMCSYSFANYVAGFLNGLPQTILPLIITNRINATESGFFYIAMMIANFINIIPTATTQSLFAEGSYGEYKLEILIKKVIKITLLIMIPIILGFVFFGKYILLFFGKQYSYQALILLQLLAISSIFVSINYIFGTVMRIKDNIKELFVFNIIGPILTISLSYILISKSLFGIGIAFMLSDLLVTLLLFAWFSRMLFKEKLKY